MRVKASKHDSEQSSLPNQSGGGSGAHSSTVEVPRSRVRTRSTATQAMSFASTMRSLPANIRAEILMSMGCKNAILISEKQTEDDRRALYSTFVDKSDTTTALFRHPKCASMSMRDDYDRCSRFYQNCAVRDNGHTMDNRVLALDDVSIRGVLAQHRTSIVSGTFYPPIGMWDVSKVTNMSMLFATWDDFNAPLQQWDTCKVTDMYGMFTGAAVFNQPVPFDTCKVTDMHGMFSGAAAFNRPVCFEAGKVIDMKEMFRGATEFDGVLTLRRTQNVRHMEWMFYDAESFNRPLALDTRRVINMSGMFCGARNFNRPLHFFTQRVVHMSNMFDGAVRFNQPLEFDMRNVETAISMFENAQSLAQQMTFDLTSVRNVTNMFDGCHPDARIRVTSDARALAATIGLADLQPRLVWRLTDETGAPGIRKSCSNLHTLSGVWWFVFCETFARWAYKLHMRWLGVAPYGTAHAQFRASGHRTSKMIFNYVIVISHHLGISTDTSSCYRETSTNTQEYHGWRARSLTRACMHAL